MELNWCKYSVFLSLLIKHYECRWHCNLSSYSNFSAVITNFKPNNVDNYIISLKEIIKLIISLKWIIKLIHSIEFFQDSTEKNHSPIRKLRSYFQGYFYTGCSSLKITNELQLNLQTSTVFVPWCGVSQNYF